MGNTINKKLFGLDHLRAVAILFVFFFHYFILSNATLKWLPNFLKFGWTGVDLFFVLSGFLISVQLFLPIKLNQAIPIKQFFLKRFFRIIPLYLVVVCIYFCMPFFREKENLPPLWKFLTFTQNIGLDLNAFGAFSHAWSLCVEEHFYLLFPFILFLLHYTGLLKRAYWLVLAIFLLGFATRFYSFTQLYIPRIGQENGWMYWYKHIYYPTYNRLDGILVGVSIAAVYVFLPNVWNRIRNYGNFIFGFGLLILAGCYFLCYDKTAFNASIFGFPLIAIGYGFVVAAAVSETSFLYKWNSRLTTFIATISYSVYLTHKGVIHLTLTFLSDYVMHNNVRLLICMITCISFAYLLHFIVERPFMKWRSRMIEAK
ncbi:MAG: acyltransferase [Bacteroidetes bacterium]|nr:acyltransferase [Bacteroidota bacterium]